MTTRAIIDLCDECIAKVRNVAVSTWVNGAFIGPVPRFCDECVGHVVDMMKFERDRTEAGL